MSAEVWSYQCSTCFKVTCIVPANAPPGKYECGEVYMPGLLCALCSIRKFGEREAIATMQVICSGCRTLVGFKAAETCEQHGKRTDTLCPPCEREQYRKAGLPWPGPAKPPAKPFEGVDFLTGGEHRRAM